MPYQSDHVELDSPYSDDDIKFLLEIVQRAQQSREPRHAERPLKSLLTAHDQVLAQYGKNLSLDTTYFDFILKYGNELGKGGTSQLVDRFVALLWHRYGILLELDNQPNGTPEITEHGPITLSDGALAVPVRPMPRRRASFNDSHLEETWMSAKDLPGRHARLHATPRAGSTRRNRSSGARPASRDRHGHHGRGDERMSYHTRHDSPAQHLDINSFELPSAQPGPQTFLERPLQEKAKTMKQQLNDTASALAVWSQKHRVLSLWYSQYHLSRQHHADLWLIAETHDRRILLRQSLGQMRDNYFERRFWRHQEKKAVRARDLFLLTKAFTHWAQIAGDEALRTRLARRHVLKIRYFKAWRDMALENDRHCRRLTLKRPLSKWRNRASQVAVCHSWAVSMNDTRLVRHAYWTWFWSFCERKAPLWKDMKLETQYLSKLFQVHRTKRWQDILAQDIRDRSVRRKAMTRLLFKARSLRTITITADSYCYQRLLSTSLCELRSQARLGPLQSRARFMTNQRLLAKVMTIWRWSTCLCRQAVTVEQQRLLRNAFTQWNDSLRVKALLHRTDDRVTAQALFQWIMHARLILFRRITDQRLISRALHTMRMVRTDQVSSLGHAYFIVRYTTDRNLASTCMLHMHTRLRVIEQHEQTAQENIRARALRRVFGTLNERASRLAQLDRWSANARFYCLTNGALKSWKEATAASRRARRHRAFEVVRQTGKTKAGLQCLRTWQQKARHVKFAMQEAEFQSRQRAYVVLRELFRRWRDCAYVNHDQDSKADVIATRRCLQTAFDHIARTAKMTHERQGLSSTYLAEVIEKDAARMLKKFSTRWFDLRYLREKAVAWEERKALQHRRYMLQHWAAQAAERRASGTIDDIRDPWRRDTSTRQGTGDESVVPVDSAHGTVTGEQTSTARESEDDLMRHESTKDVGTPRPGYLQTPSKRSARARARFKAGPGSSLLQYSVSAAAVNAEREARFGSSVMSSTTPAPLIGSSVLDMDALTPQITPFQRKLRAGGYQGDSRTPALGRSIFGNLPSTTPAAARLGRS